MPESEYPVVDPSAPPSKPTSSFFPPEIVNPAGIASAPRPLKLANDFSYISDILEEYENLLGSVHRVLPKNWSSGLGYTVFRNHLFYITGFQQDIKDRILSMIFVGGGRRQLYLTPQVTTIIVGERCDPDTLDRIETHPTGATCMKVAWLLHELRPELEKTLKLF